MRTLFFILSVMFWIASIGGLVLTYTSMAAELEGVPVFNLPWAVSALIGFTIFAASTYGLLLQAHLEISRLNSQLAQWTSEDAGEERKKRRLETERIESPPRDLFE